MADHVIDADAAGMLIAAIADGGRFGTGVIDLLLDHRIQRAGGLAGKHMFGHFIKDPAGQCARGMHAREIHGFVDADAVTCQSPAMFVLHGLIPGFRRGCRAWGGI